MAKKVELKERGTGEILYPVTLSEHVITSDNRDLLTVLNSIGSGGGSAEIANGSITTEKLATDSVTTAKIKDLNVTTEKIANKAITSAKLAQDSISREHIIDTAVGNSKLANKCVTMDKLSDDVLTILISNGGELPGYYICSAFANEELDENTDVANAGDTNELNTIQRAYSDGKLVVFTTANYTLVPNTFIELNSNAYLFTAIVDDKNNNLLLFFTIKISNTTTAIACTRAMSYSSGTTVIDNLTSSSTSAALSANQGKVLNEKFAPYILDLNQGIEEFSMIPSAQVYNELKDAILKNKQIFYKNKDDGFLVKASAHMFVDPYITLSFASGNLYLVIAGTSDLFLGVTTRFILELNIVNNLTTTSTTAPLSAALGKVLNDKITGVNAKHKVEYLYGTINFTALTTSFDVDSLMEALFEEKVVLAEITDSSSGITESRAISSIVLKNDHYILTFIVGKDWLSVSFPDNGGTPVYSTGELLMP